VTTALCHREAAVKPTLEWAPISRPSPVLQFEGARSCGQVERFWLVAWATKPVAGPEFPRLGLLDEQGECLAGPELPQRHQDASACSDIEGGNRPGARR
jgi:hypothetical protein